MFNNKKHDNTPSEVTQPILRRKARRTVQFDTTDEYYERVKRATVASLHRQSEPGAQRRRRVQSHAPLQAWAIGIIALGPDFEVVMGSDYVIAHSEDEAHEAAFETALHVFQKAKGFTCHHVELTLFELIHMMQVVESARGQ